MILSLAHTFTGESRDFDRTRWVVQDGLLRCHMRKAFYEVDFHNWKEVVSVNVGGYITQSGAVSVFELPLRYSSKDRGLGRLL